MKNELHTVSELIESYIHHLHRLFFGTTINSSISEHCRAIATDYTHHFAGTTATELAQIGRDHCSFVTKKFRDTLENRHLMHRDAEMIQLYSRVDTAGTMHEVFANLFADIVILLGIIKHCYIIKKREQTLLTVSADRTFVNSLRL